MLGIQVGTNVLFPSIWASLQQFYCMTDCTMIKALFDPGAKLIVQKTSEYQQKISSLKEENTSFKNTNQYWIVE